MILKEHLHGLRKYRSFCLIVFVFCMTATFSFFATRGVKDSSAASLSNFRAGNIMSDAVMGSYNTMSVQDIQNFLNAKGNCNNRNWSLYQSLKSQYPNTDWHWANGHFVCLAEERFGDGTVVGSGQTAAEIIYQAAQDYKINPQVLLVLLQKEQGLITDDYPNSRQYRSATGFGCPDTAACDSQYYGFKNQVRRAANMFRTVLDGGWSNYPAGQTVYVQYNPNRGCGGTNVYIENRATSALYRYTPYQPNASALNAGYGTGDSCGAYGNRNFYLYFSDWFGDPQKDYPIADYQVMPDGEYMIASGLTYDTVLAADGQANGANVAMHTRDSGNKNQWWKLQYNRNDKSYTFINVANGRALDLYGQYTNNGTNINTYDSNGTCAQKWHAMVNGDGTFTFASACSKSIVLDVDSGSKFDGANVQVYTNNGTVAQRWRFIPRATITDGMYNIITGTNTNLRLDIHGGINSASNGSNVWVYNSNQTAAQRWQITYNSQDGTYTIINPHNELSLDVKGGSVAEGTNVQIYASNNTAAQRWYILPQGDGYMIVSAGSGRVLDVYGGSKQSGTNVNIYGSNMTNAQKWRFEPATIKQEVTDGVYELIAGTSDKKALDVYGGASYSGANVQIYDRNQTNAQKWRITYDKRTDSYDIVNPASNLSLDVYGGLTADGTNVQIYSSNNTLAQKWTLRKNDDNSFTIY